MAKTPTKIRQKPKGKRVSNSKQEGIIASEPEMMQEKISEEKKPNESARVSTIISIVSVVLVLLNIVITTAFGLYQQMANQKFQAEQQAQQQLFQEELQKQAIDLQQQSEIANIAITSSTEEILNGDSSLNPIHGIISIINKGPAPAKNLRIEICMQSAEWPWRQEITDISNFNIHFTKASINSSKEINKDCQSNFDATGINDTILFDIPSLTANQKVTILIELDSQQIEYKNIESNKSVFVNLSKSYVPQNSDANSYFLTSFSSFLNKKFPLASFLGSAFCDNCVLESNNDYYATTIASLYSYEISNEQTIFDDLGFLKLSYDLHITEIIPISYETSVIRISNPLYLYLTQDIAEIDKNTFDDFEAHSKECGDGIDNDGDGFIDWPADPDCSNKNDNDESR